ncbi:MAG: LEA type 2 family protein [Flavobacteriaceae bacterium]|nr:LEA type 2 family protein [Flavobacteriaceae bacterium]
MIHIRSLSLLTILILICSCGREYISPEIKSVKNVVLLDQNNDLVNLSFDLEIFNQNNFDFKYNEINLDVTYNNKSVAKIESNKKNIVKKNSIDNIPVLLSVNLKNLDEQIFSDENLIVNIDGYIKRGLFKIKIQSSIDLYNERYFSDLVDQKFVNQLIHISSFSLESVTGPIASFNLDLNLNNNFPINFELTQLNAKIYNDSQLKRLIAISESASTVKVKEYSSLQVPLKLDVNLISFGPSILLGSLSKDYTMYLEIDLIIKLNEKSIPIKLLKKIIVNTKSLEITIE